MSAVNKIYALLSVIIIGSIVGLIVLTARYNQAVMDSYVAVHHTLIVLDETQQTLATVLEMDQGKPQGAITGHIRNLRLLTADNRLQVQRVDSLYRYITTISGRRDYTTRLREILIRIQGEENRLLALREVANTKSNGLLNNAIFGLLLIILAAFGISAFMILYNFRQRRKAEKGLAASEQQFSLLVQHIKEYAVFLIDAKGRVLTWNEGAEKIKGYTAGEVIGQHISLFYTEAQKLIDEPSVNLRRAAESGRHECRGWRRRKDGTLFYADVIFTAMLDDRGNVSGYVKITKDITEQTKAEEEMKFALSREKELNEMKSRFVTLASHEFKTPLSVILSSTVLIEKYNTPEMEDKRLRHTQRIKSNVKNLRQILNDFLSLEKLEEGIVTNNPAATDLLDLAEDVILDMTESCKKGQQIVLEMTGESRIVIVDDHLLRNILNNLISNAIKYSPENSLILFIIAYYPTMVCFSIIDKGIGIPKREQEHLFQRFFRATNTSGISGTGLGLSIVRKYLDLMGGAIEVRSEPNDGSTFTVKLPAVA